MNYLNSYSKMKKAFDANETKVEFDDFELHKFEFNSKAKNILPGNDDCFCETHNLNFKKINSYNEKILIDEIQIEDICVEENRHFCLHLLKSKINSNVKQNNESKKNNFSFARF